MPWLLSLQYIQRERERERERERMPKAKVREGQLGILLLCQQKGFFVAFSVPKAKKRNAAN
jgi:hypothetical protein